MGNEVDKIVQGEVLPDDDPRDIRALGFDKLTPAERSEISRRGLEARRRNRRARELAKLEVYTDAHRELASRILGSKIVVLDGLQAEMQYTDDDGNIQLDTSKLTDSRLRLYLSLLDTLEKRGFGSTVTRTESKSETTVDVRAVIAKINRDLGSSDE